MFSSIRENSVRRRKLQVVAEETFWRRAGKTALNVVTLGATRRVDVVRAEAEAADKEYQAAYEHIVGLQSRAKSLAEARGDATRKAHADLQNLVDLLTALGGVTAFQSGSVKDQCDITIGKIQKTIVDFNVAIELVTASGAGAVTSAGAWAVVSALGGLLHWNGNPRLIWRCGKQCGVSMVWWWFTC